MLLRSFISYGSSRSNKHHRNRGFRSGSSSVIGCEASYLHHGGSSSNFDDIKEEVAAGEMASLSGAADGRGGRGGGGGSGVSGGNGASTVDLSGEAQGHLHQQTRLETHSCPSSPTETDCSSGFSTLRRRSVTVTEKVS